MNVRLWCRLSFIAAVCLFLKTADCSERSAVTWNYLRQPGTTLYYKALALHVPKAMLRYYREHPQWPLQRKVEYLKSPWLRQSAEVPLLMVKALYEGEQYQRALLWSESSQLSGNIDNELLKIRILIALKRFDEAETRLQGKVAQKSTQSQMLLVQLYLQSERLERALKLLKQSKGEDAAPWKRQLHSLLSNSLFTDDCRLHVQFLVGGIEQLKYSADIMERWRNDKSVAAMDICFNAPMVFDPMSLNCQDRANEELRCDLTLMAEKIKLPEASLPVVVHGSEGKANYNNGIIFTGHRKGYGVFKHELMHHLGFLDEYRLSGRKAEQVCDVDKPSPVGANLYVVPERFSASVELDGKTRVATCDGQGAVAYKSVRELTVMEFVDQPMPTLYTEIASDRLHRQFSQMANYQYAFALAFERKGIDKQYRYWLHRSAEQGYAVAQSLLTF